MSPSKRCWVTAGLLAIITGYTFCSECPLYDSENVLQRGYKYSYHFKTEAFGEAVGTTNDRSRMILECNVKITHVYDCFYSLLMKDCSFSTFGGPPESETALIDERKLFDLSKYPIKFSLVHGAVKNVYKDPDDAIFFVNIKRGALSAFVFKLSAISERKRELITDIHGTCPRETLLASDDSVITSKDMMQCAFPSRPDWQLSPWSIFWNMSFIQYQINSTVDCEYKVNFFEKHLDEVHCKERHAIGLESTHRTTTAVQTNIYYQMIFVKSEKLKEKLKKATLSGIRTGIEFEYDRTPDPDIKSQPEDFLHVAQNMLTDLVETSHEEIRLFTIPKFTDFVAWLRTSYELNPFIKSVRDCSFLGNRIPCSELVKDLSMAYLSDALVQCQTLPCVKAVSELAVDGAFSNLYLNFILYSWSNMYFTKAEAIPHIMKICESKDTRFCWLSLGTIVGKHYKSTLPKYDMAAKEVREVINHFSNSIGKTCEPPYSFTSEEKKSEHLLTYLKAIGNSIEAYILYAQDGVIPLVKCVNREDLPIYIRTAAIEVLKLMNICDTCLSSCLTVHDELGPMLLNASINVDLRIAAYMQLINVPERYNFENDVISVLKNEKNSQILSYIASDLTHRIADAEYRKAYPYFVNTIVKLLEQNNIVLESLQDIEGAKSHSSEYGHFTQFSFLPKDIEGFGAKLYSSIIYRFYNQIPHRFKTSIILQLFNKVIDALTVGGHFEGWQGVAIALHKVGEEVTSKSFSVEELSKILNDLVNVIKKDSKPQKHFKFDRTIIKNIKDIYSVYQKNTFLPNPFFDLYFQMFGSTLHFLTSVDILELNSITDDFQRLITKLRDGVIFNNTRVIRVIEAFHQVPTMMGLSLNWTTNATLAFSMRRGLKLNFGKDQKNELEMHANGFIQPSAALTFLNRMVLDFPTFTQIGIQANSSGYTSTQLKATLDFSNNSKVFKIEAPVKPQKFLELFRTNQIIKGDSYDEIPDWDIERTSAAWCLDDQTSSALGLEVCHERSYPNVTHLIKPWALMAGWCKWRLELLPFDRKLKSYNFELLEIPSAEYEKKLELKISAPGTALKREVLVDVSLNMRNGEVKSNVHIPDLPEFSLSISRNSLLENNKFIGFWDVVLLKISDSLKYKLTQNQERRIEERKEESASGNISPKTKTLLATVEQREIKLETPYNYYVWIRKTYRQGGNMKTDVHAVYENLDSQWNFLSKILPSTFWESESKASVRLLFNWKSSSKKPKETAIHYITGQINTPKSSIELLSNTLTMSGRTQFNTNLTKIEVATGKLVSFINFTYDLWSNENSGQNAKEIKMINLTIPQRSWSLQIKQSRESNKQLYSMIFTRAKMTLKDTIQKNAVSYVGWWSDDVKDLFDLEQMVFKFTADIENRYPENSALLAEFTNIKEEEITGLMSKYIIADVVFSYPHNNKDEVLTFNGKFLLSASPAIFRFQKDFVLLSSYNNLQLDSHSVYKSEENKLMQLLHNSFFTHTASETKAFYNMDFKKVMNEDGCLVIDFNHNITSHVYNMVSSVHYFCHSKNTKEHTLTLNLDSSSPYWKMLDMHIRQIIEDVTSTYSVESMNFTSPNLIINVTADWNGKYHKKNAIFTKIPENVQVMKITLDNVHPEEYHFQLLVPRERGDIEIICNRKLSDDYKKLKIDFYFPNIEHQIVHLHGNIMNPKYRIWKVELFPGMRRFITFVTESTKRMSVALRAVADDADHPLNKMLEPALKVTLAQYLSELGTDAESAVRVAFVNFKEAIFSLKPFFEPSVSVVTNIYHAVDAQVRALYSVIEEKSITIWAIKYFELPQLVREKFRNLPDIMSLIRSVLLPYEQNENIKNYYPAQSFVFRTGRLLKWRAFNEMPTLDLDGIKFLLPAQAIQGHKEIEPHHNPSPGSKIGMILGPRHVYTFDGQLYEFPKYPSEDCAYLLAHDIHGSKFSAVATAEFIHLLFPELVISINSKDEVYIDGSETPQSLPFQASNGTVAIRREGNVLMVWSPSLTVLCQGQNFLCTLEVNAWNGAGTIGLLGNADGEIFNDFMLPDGSVTSDIRELAHSYELSGDGRCRDLKVEPKLSPTENQREHCVESMNRVCSFYDNLRQHFFEPCVTYLAENDNTCYSEIALSALCYHKQQQMMTECNLSQQKKKKSNTKYKLEVVLVVNEHMSMLSDRSTNLKKGIESVVSAVHKQFESHGYSTILFSLVGFGGDGVHYHPSVHAVGSNIWMTYKEAISDLLPTLEFKGTEQLNPVTAVKYAAEVLGHDTFDKKVFIVFTDSDKEVTDKGVLNLVQSYLDKNHITVYTISSYPSIEKGKKVFGVRADGLIFPMAKKGEDFLDYPRGNLAKLTSGTRGSLFLKKFVDVNDPASYFIELAQEVWAKVRKEVGFCRICKSVRSGWWHRQYECHLVDCV